jgi:serine/threonine-protein kinase
MGPSPAPGLAPFPKGINPVGPSWPGGHSQVYLVFHEKTERELAFKRLIVSGEHGKEAAAREFEMMRSLHRVAPRYFVEVVDFSSDDPHGPWLLMRYASRGSLRDRIGRDQPEPLPFAEAYTVLCQTARGVDAAHAAGIAHRDIKPGNILLDAGATLGDLGISHRVLERDATPPRPYTRRYASPELIVATRAYQSGTAPPPELVGIDAEKRNDRYSHVTVAYEMLCAETPFHDSDERVGAEPPDPQRFNPAIGERTAAVLLQGVAADWQQRPASAWAFAEDLGRAMVADGQNQALDAQTAAPEPSADRLAALRRDRPATPRRTTRSASERTVSRPPQLTKTRTPKVPGGATATASEAGRGRVARRVDRITLATIALLVAVLVGYDRLEGPPAWLNHMLVTARRQLDAVQAFIDIDSVAWPAMAAGLTALGVAALWRRGPRLTFGALAVGAVALSLQADANRSLTLGRAEPASPPVEGHKTQPQPQRAKRKPGRKVAARVQDSRRPGNARASKSASRGSSGGSGRRGSPSSSGTPPRFVSAPGSGGRGGGGSGGGKSKCGCGGPSVQPKGQSRARGGDWGVETDVEVSVQADAIADVQGSGTAQAQAEAQAQAGLEQAQAAVQAAEAQAQQAIAQAQAQAQQAIDQAQQAAGEWGAGW